MQFMISKILLSALVVFVAMGFTSCKSCQYEKPEKSNTIGMSRVVCDEGFGNILEQEIEVFEFHYPEASILPFYVSQSAVIDSLINFKADFGVAACKLTQEQEDYIRNKTGFCVTQRIAVDAIAVIVNKQNSVDSLSMSQLSKILTGKVATWNELGFEDGDSIKIVFDDPKSSVVKYVSDSLLNGEPFSKNVYAQKSNPKVFSTVTKGKNTLGFLDVTWINDTMDGKAAPTAERVAKLDREDTTKVNFKDEVKVLKIYDDGAIKAFKPYQAYIYDGTYPLYRNIYAICTTSGGAPAKGFFDFVTSYIGQKIIMQTGILPSVIHPRMVSLN